MFLRLALLVLLLADFGRPARADDRLIRLAVPQALQDSGLMQYILPRFSLKTQVRVQTVAPADGAEVALGDKGTPVFEGAGQVWAVALLAPDHPGAKKFFDWLTAPVGERAVAGFKREGEVVFTKPVAKRTEAPPPTYDGDPVLGRKLAIADCGRCHVSIEGDPHRGIGSTPSFFVLRALPDWEERLRTFYLRAPHPSFTQVQDVTYPFPEDVPPPVHPLHMTMDDIEAILAYAATLKPADLGAPLKVWETHQ